MKKCLIVLFVLCLAACASSPSGPVYSQTEVVDSTKARVYIYRVKSFAGAAWQHDYWINKKLVARLSSHGFTSILVSPGTYQIHYGATADYDELVININLEAGKDYYFRESPMKPAPEEAIVKAEDVNTTTGTFAAGLYIPISWNDAFAHVKKEFAVKELAKGYRFQKPLISVYE